MKANELRKIMASALANHNAFYGFNSGAFDEYNYKINYDIENAILLEGQRTYIVSIDVWCKETTRVDEIADTMEGLFNYRTYEDATFYLDNRYHADEKNIYRRTLMYEVRTFMED